jgi:hypothetical protein
MSADEKQEWAQLIERFGQPQSFNLREIAVLNCRINY